VDPGAVVEASLRRAATDGDCDVVTTPREHAFLIPERGKLAFRTERPVFRFSDD
jgi:hypothetical protein